jgi:hypothetical protein
MSSAVTVGALGLCAACILGFILFALWPVRAASRGTVLATKERDGKRAVRATAEAPTPRVASGPGGPGEQALEPPDTAVMQGGSRSAAPPAEAGPGRA